ncbi:hypothetical protein T11_159 [Trichinella zimbabwensis]|uniref:Uncharacterized protein n=2 Tax=Trichinella zimbabwensis TaxID=268475 RepID=A0A0V1HJQ0_9BILA|nr:hypothetical protein T11_159 [Trichinella zimbabwensis]
MPTSQLMNGCLIYVTSLPNVSSHQNAAAKTSSRRRQPDVGQSYPDPLISRNGILSSKPVEARRSSVPSTHGVVTHR